MTKRSLHAMIIALTLCVSLCACTKNATQSETGPFILVIEGDIGKGVDQTIMYDPDTMVMYTYLDGIYIGSMSELYNADGTLKLYSPNTEYVIFTVVKEGGVGEYANQTVMYDPDTMVMYTYLNGAYAGTMSVLYNADGTLKIYSPER